jgi:hypothetical protein
MNGIMALAMLVLPQVAAIFLCVMLMKKGKLTWLNFALIFASGFNLSTVGTVLLAVLLSDSPNAVFALLFALALSVTGFASAIGVAYLCRSALESMFQQVSRRPAD